MAKYLWTSQTVGTGATASAHIAKYCFNAPGNWRVFNEVTKVWGATTGTPNIGNLATVDSVYIGCKNIPNEGWTYGPSGDNGWTHAKNPLLFGGYSGSFPNLGNWYYAKGYDGVSYGTTWLGGLALFNHNVSNVSPVDFPRYPTDITTSQPSRCLFHNDVTDYPFPYLGGGISGEIAEWCANRDGLTVGDYVVQNYPGFRDPRENLKIRIVGNIILQDLRAFTGSDQKMIIDLALVRSPNSPNGLSPFDSDFSPPAFLTSQAGWQFNYLLASGTNLHVKTLNGVGVRIRGGHLYNVYLNSSNIDLSGEPNPLHVYDRSRLSSERIDYGIEIHDATVMKCTIAEGQNTLLRNGNYAKITLWPKYGMGYHRPYIRLGAGWTGTWTNQGIVMNSTAPNTNTLIGITSMDHRGMVQMPYNYNSSLTSGSITRHTCDAPQIILANGWNWLKCWWELRGYTHAIIDNFLSPAAGKLIFDCKTNFNPYFNRPYYTQNTWQSMFYEPGVQNIANNIHPNPPFGFTPYQLSKQRRNVILGDPDNPDFEGANVPNGSQALTGGLYEIVLDNTTATVDPNEQYPHDAQLQELSSLYLPWNLHIVSKANIQKINMINGFMTLSPNLSAAHTVRVAEINLMANSTIDLSDSKSADFRVGTMFYAPGFSGADGQAYLQGGIKFLDNTCNKIIGSIPQAYWNEINYDSLNRSIRHFSAGEILGGYTATNQSI